MKYLNFDELYNKVAYNYIEEKEDSKEADFIKEINKTTLMQLNNLKKYYDDELNDIKGLERFRGKESELPILVYNRNLNLDLVVKITYTAIIKKLLADVELNYNLSKDLLYPTVREEISNIINILYKELED